VSINQRAATRRPGFSKLLLILIAWSLYWPCARTQVKPVRRVLVLNELGLSAPAITLADQEIRAELEKSPYQIELYSEYLETTLFPDEASQKLFREWYIRKYRDRKPDVIIAAGPASLDFMVQAHHQYFPGTPVVFTGIAPGQAKFSNLGPDFTGVWATLDSSKTLDAALKLQPATQHVVLVSGVSPSDRKLQSFVRNGLRGYESRLDLQYLTDLSMPALLDRLRHLAKNTIVMYVTFSQDAVGTVFINSLQSLPLTLGAANAPVYTLGDTLVGQGAVGGYVISYGEQGRVAGKMAVRILGGERPRDIPIVNGTNVYMFDWRTLHRWGLAERKLPPGSLVLYRKPTFWEAYEQYVIAGIFLCLAQTLLILALLWHRAKRRKVEKSLYESAARLREAQGIAHCGSWIWDIAKDETHWSDEMYRILGLQPKSVTPSSRLLHLENEPHYTAKLKLAMQTHQLYGVEHTIVRPNGEQRTVVELGQPKYDAHGRPVSMIGTLLDVTEQRQAEQSLRESEQRFRTMADSAPVLMWIAGVDKRCIDFNRGWLEFTGRPIALELGDGWAEGVYPSDLQKCFSTYVTAFDRRDHFTMEYRLRRYDGEYRWVTDTGTPRFSPDGAFVGYIGCCIDINDQKEAELARLELARRLMNAQEDERSRIARELHDSIGQSIAVLSFQMQRAGLELFESSLREHFAITELTGKLKDIGIQVGRLSHQLHSSELEYLGLGIAITSLCREFSEQYPITVECSCTDLPAELDNDVALGLLRVTQEALHNIAKHSQAENVQVELTGTPNELALLIRDDGVGFEMNKSRTAVGMGLISMRERMLLVGGAFDISSNPRQGTTIVARAPVACAGEEMSLQPNEI
jgi:PAS domain S-box-containing protein